MSALTADPDQIGRFVQTMFRHADEGTFASLRSFTHNAGDPPVEVSGVEINGEGLAPLIRIAIGAANRAARHQKPTVFAPPVATFTNRNKAREADLANGVALSVEIDAAATEGLALLRGLLGPPTVVVASGGEWTDPATGEVQPKLHAHWRLSEPTRTAEDHGKLKRGRRVASALVGGDATNIPAVHPIRWPGSVHRKGEPKLANIVELNEEAEIDLGDALDRLERAAAARGIFTKGTANGCGSGGEQRETAALIAEIMSAKAYVAPLTALSARYAGGGMTRPKIVDTLQGLMLAVPAEIRDGGQPGRWQSRFNGIPRMAASAIRKFRPTAEEAQSADGCEAETHRERTALTPATINKTARRCAELLQDTIYMRGRFPSAVVPAGDINPDAILGGVQHDKSALVMVTATAGMVQYKLDERVSFFKRDVRSKSDVQVSCPKDLATRLIDAATDMPFRQCSGIVTVPLFINGEIIAEPGYHQPTGRLIAFNGSLPPIPENPTKADALAALDVLLRPFRGYLSGNDPKLRTGLAAAALTAIARPSLPAAPAIVLDANTPGAGKGKLGRAIAVLATGTLPSVITEGHGEEETEKRIASAILSGGPVLLLDNMQRTLASSALESALTEGVATIRVFGKLGEDITVPFSALVIITANNAALRADLLRRVLPIRILVDTDEPEKREFGFDPYLEAKRDRLQILAAGFTILKAWHNNRYKTNTLGSFEHWAEMVAGAVEWLTDTNPISLIEDRKAENPGRAEDRQVIAALHALFGTAKWTAKEAVGRPAPAYQAPDNPQPATGLDPELWRNVLDFKTERPSPREAGNWLRRQKDKVFGNLRLAGSLDAHSKTAKWEVICGVMRGHAGSNIPQTREMSPPRRETKFDSLETVGVAVPA